MKRFLCLLVALMLVLAPEMVNAQEMSSKEQLIQVGIQTIVIKDEDVKAVVFASSQQLSPAECTLYADSRQISVRDVRSLESVGVRSSWIILVDTQTQRDYMISAARAVLDAIPAGDAVAVLAAGDDVSTAAFGTKADAADALTAMAGKTVKNKNRNVTAGAALNYLATSTTVAERTCLVIISEGEKSVEEVTNGELDKTATASRTTVYTVDVLSEGERNANKQNMSEYGAIARHSKGGLNIPITKWSKDATPKEITKAITDNEIRFRVLVLDPADMTGFRKLEMALTSGSSSYTCSLDLTPVEAGKLQAIADARAAAEQLAATPVPVIETPTPTPAPTPEPGTMEKVTGWVQENQTLAIAAGAGLLLLIILIIVLASRKKKPEPADNSGASVDVSPSPQFGASSSGTILRLEDVETQAIYTHELSATLLVGRDSSKVDLTIDNGDRKISSAHCEFSMRKGVLYVSDFNSTNGTFVNNVRIDKPAIIHQNDVVTIGKTRLRVTW